MRDDFLARDYADHHRTLSHAIHKLIHRTAIAFEWLAAYQYAAPWRARAAHVPATCGRASVPR